MFSDFTFEDQCFISCLSPSSFRTWDFMKTAGTKVETVTSPLISALSCTEGHACKSDAKNILMTSPCCSIVEKAKCREMLFGSFWDLDSLGLWMWNWLTCSKYLKLCSRLTDEKFNLTPDEICRLTNNLRNVFLFYFLGVLSSFTDPAHRFSRAGFES